MYKTIFIKQIFNAREPGPRAEFAVFRRQEVLPFAPCAGHEFFWGDGAPQKIRAATWNVAESYFSCTVEDIFVDPYSIDGPDFEELVEDTKNSGWALVRVFDPPTRRS